MKCQSIVDRRSSTIFGMAPVHATFCLISRELFVLDLSSSKHLERCKHVHSMLPCLASCSGRRIFLVLAMPRIILLQITTGCKFDHLAGLLGDPPNLFEDWRCEQSSIQQLSGRVVDMDLAERVEIEYLGDVEI